MEYGEFEYHSANVIATDPLQSARPVSKTLIASKALRLGISYFVVYMLFCSFVFVSPILNLLIIAICISEQYGAFSLAGSIKYDHFIGRFIGLDSKSWQEPKTVLRLQESIIKSGRRSATITFFENGSYQIQKDQ